MKNITTKSFLILCLCLIFIPKGFAQTYTITHQQNEVSFAKGNVLIVNDSQLLYPDTRWSVLQTNSLNPSVSSITYYNINGDTIINSLFYYKLYINNNQLFTYLREDNLKLYAYFPELPFQNEKLVYDFNSWVVGGTYRYNVYDYIPDFYPEYNQWNISKLDTIQLNDGKYYQIANNDVINTIGSIYGIFAYTFDWPSDGSVFHLLTYYRNGVLIYDKTNDFPPTSTNDIYVDKNGQIIFYFDNDTLANLERILLYSVDGKLLKIIKYISQNSLSIQNFQNGIYLYKLIYSNNKIKSGKFIKK